MSVEAPELPAVVEETIPPTAAPEAPASVAPTAAVEETATADPTTSASRPRGPDGRFIKADGTQASEVEQAAIEAADSASPPIAATAPTPTPVAPVSQDPFVFRGGGQRHQFPGATVSPEGHVTITAEQVPQLKQLLADAVEHRGSWRQKTADYERRIQEAGSVQEARAKKYNDAAVLLWDKIQSPDWLAAAAQDPREVEYLKRELGLALKSADLATPKAPEQPAGPSEQEIERAAQQTLVEYVDELLEQPAARAVYDTDEKRQKVKAAYLRRIQAYFVEQNGDILLHENAVDADWKEELEARDAIRRENQEKARKLADAAAKNAANNVSAPKVPNVVPAKGSATPSEAPAKKDRAQWAREMGLA